MDILVINCGSSSIKADVIDTTTKGTKFSLTAERIGKDLEITMNGIRHEYNGENDFEALLIYLLKVINETAIAPQIKAVGHRVVHGGDIYQQPILIDENVERNIELLCPLAPLHNPSNLLGIKFAQKQFPSLPNIAVFDTAFHQTIPNRAKYYAIDKSLSDKYNIKRYGFHGTSHKYVVEKASKYLQTELKNLRIISCHLGNGASVCAVEYGRSVETSMGMTPLEGLVMGTRSGDIDVGAIFHLAKQEHLTLEELDNILNNKSGLLGLSGKGNDMRDILKNAENGDENCMLAIQVFTHRLTKYIGAYAAIMGGVDVLIFTGGIGENSSEIRNRVCQKMNFLGIDIDDDINKSAHLDDTIDVINISDETARVKVLTIKTNEELAIALETQKIVEDRNKVNVLPKIPVAVSARHVHLSQNTLEILFGKGYQLTVFKPLSQPGQFAANEMVTLVGLKNKIENVRILGPVRNNSQVEISRTDEFFLGIDAPVRESGNIEGTPGITILGPKGSVILKEGVIQAWRHIHMHTNDAKIFGVKDKDIVSVNINDNERALTFKNVLIRVSDQYKLEMHIDTDEGNAAQIDKGEHGDLVFDISCTLEEKNV
jgi:acetate kinase